MKKLMFIFLIFMAVASCKTTKYGKPSAAYDKNYRTVFLDLEYKGVVKMVNGNEIIPLQNNDSAENFILFNLIKKAGNWFEVAAWNSYDESYIGTGKIYSDVPICIFSREYLPYAESLRLYATPSYSSSYISDTTYRAEGLRVVDFKGKWLKVKVLIDNKEHIGWMPPEMQCPSVYTTCC